MPDTHSNRAGRGGPVANNLCNPISVFRHAVLPVRCVVRVPGAVVEEQDCYVAAELVVVPDVVVEVAQHCYVAAEVFRLNAFVATVLVVRSVAVAAADYVVVRGQHVVVVPGPHVVAGWY